MTIDLEEADSIFAFPMKMGNQKACCEGDRVGELLINKIPPESVIIGNRTEQVLSMGSGIGRSAGNVEYSPEMAQVKETGHFYCGMRNPISKICLRRRFK